MAIVPDKECRMPTLIGPVSAAFAGAAVSAGAAAAADPEAAAVVAGAVVPGPWHAPSSAALNDTVIFKAVFMADSLTVLPLALRMRG
jgi:hypothetical protein